MKQNGLTIIELLVFLVNVVVGTVVSAWGWHRFGWLGLIVGFMSGFAIIPTVFCLAIFLLRLHGSGRDGGPRGVLVMAYGDRKYIRLAQNLARSLAVHNPELPRALVTDSNDPALRKLFHILVPVRPEYGGGFDQKAAMNLYSPFARTLFIDADCLVFGPLDHLWDVFNDVPVGVVGTSLTAGDCKFHPQVETLLQQLGREFLPLFNGGLYYFDNSATAQQIFADARSAMTNYDALGLKRVGINRGEEAAIAVALALNRVAPKPDADRIMRSTYRLWGPLHMDVLRGRIAWHCRRSGAVVKPVIAHLLWPIYEEPIYKREVVKLRLGRWLPWPRAVTGALINVLFNPPYAAYALLYRGWKRWRTGVTPIMPLPLWMPGGPLPPWRPPWDERRTEQMQRRAWRRRLAVRLMGYRLFQRFDAWQQKRKEH
jgi:hypothetical protein